jgi:tRNA (guanine-N7-)-methyltransferase
MTVRSFVKRGGRLGPQLRTIMESRLPVYEMPAEPWKLADYFPDVAGVVLEIGSGMGEATLAMAAAEPRTGIVAVEVHDRGVAALVRGLDEAGLANVRVMRADAVEVLQRYLAAASLAGIRVWFPDPWPKTKHHKRRLISPAVVALMADRLAPDGTLHVATDVAGYAQVIGEVLHGCELLQPVVVDGPRPSWRPVTKFEAAGRDAGRDSHDFIFRRR